mmetsp:Transcript_33801/g.97135  ORF Transcript_33801/g.97135 Transcript_33801/m.97135 type:complete len:250 (-) Transcript_33801:319-1068(-)
MDGLRPRCHHHHYGHAPDLLGLPPQGAERPARQDPLAEEGCIGLHGRKLHGRLHCHHRGRVPHHCLGCHTRPRDHCVGYLARDYLVVQGHDLLDAHLSFNPERAPELDPEEVLLRKRLPQAQTVSHHLHVLADLAVLPLGHHVGARALRPGSRRCHHLAATSDGCLHPCVHEPGRLLGHPLQAVHRCCPGLPHTLQPSRPCRLPEPAHFAEEPAEAHQGGGNARGHCSSGGSEEEQALGGSPLAEAPVA